MTETDDYLEDPLGGTESEYDSEDRERNSELEEQPEFYDATADDRNETWVNKMRSGHRSDAILSCPLCFSTVCVDCQQHERYGNQFRAMFVLNCRVNTEQIVRPQGETATTPATARAQQAGDENYNPVCCTVCGTEIGLRELPPSGVYHLFNVVASNA
jgi:hypothetical protein